MHFIYTDDLTSLVLTPVLTPVLTSALTSVMISVLTSVMTPSLTSALTSVMTSVLTSILTSIMTSVMTSALTSILPCVRWLCSEKFLVFSHLDDDIEVRGHWEMSDVIQWTDDLVTLKPPSFCSVATRANQVTHHG